VGWNLDGAVQLAADGSNGLRGYKLHAFTGDRRLIMNLEDRILLTPEIAHLVQLSAAAFLDAGRAWPTGNSFVFEDLGTDVGAGLRIGLPRASRQNIWRIDVAYPLRPDLTGRQAWMLSFSSSQAF
jgi:hemolysin activation/secretion protein